jgi:hypothetical protein
MSRFVFALLALAAVALPLSASADSRYRYDDSYDGRYDDRYDDRYRGAAEIRCSSKDGRTRYCNVDTRGGVRLVRQESRSPCIQGRTWGVVREGVWVANGCRARFQVGGGQGRGYGGQGYGGQGYAYGNGAGYGAQVVRCESRDGRQSFCRVPGGLREAQIVRRLSDTRCQQGYNWGFQRDGIWVDRGCRAEFSVY